jgi:LPS-assembly lipoprotein
MKKTFTKICLILTSILLLSGCGFTLRTAKSLPPQLHKVYYQTNNPYGEFETTLKRALKASDIIFLETPDSATPILDVTSNYTYSVPSSVSSAQARTYTLNYSATVSINEAFNKQILTPKTVSASRSISLQSNEVFEISPQIEIVKRELRQELSTKILNVLCAPKTFQALAKDSDSKQVK